MCINGSIRHVNSCHKPADTSVDNIYTIQDVCTKWGGSEAECRQQQAGESRVSL